MRIVVAGGTGFLGSALVTALEQGGHQVVVLTRRPRADNAKERRQGVPVEHVQWAAGGSDLQWWNALESADAIVNLAGESIAGGRWTTSRKAAIRDSRVRATGALASAIKELARPRVFVSASAIGIYGPRGDEPVTEATPPGFDFLAGVCREWEAQAMEAASVARVALLRTGLVLASVGGELPQIALPFRFFAGGVIGSGKQYMSWIHRDDWVSLVRWALDTEMVSGPVNLTAPNPVTNEEFTSTLASVLGRPAFVPAPAFALRLVLGEMADALLLTGQRVLPAKAKAMGFRFRYERLDDALRAIYR